MSDIKAQLTEDIKALMKARELDKVKVLRNVQSVIKQIEIDRATVLEDSEVMTILQKQIKQRQESLKVFLDNDRTDLAEKEQFELDLINHYLPQAMSDEDLDKLVDAEIARQGASGMQDMGKVMGAIKQKSAGRADSARISVVVKNKLS